MGKQNRSNCKKLIRPLVFINKDFQIEFVGCPSAPLRKRTVMVLSLAYFAQLIRSTHRSITKIGG
ncbi:MAG: hypothetical protein WDA08_11760 [Weeksellaceae bacterium]